MSDANLVMLAARQKATWALSQSQDLSLRDGPILHAAIVSVYCDAYRDALEYAKKAIQEFKL